MRKDRQKNRTTGLSKKFAHVQPGFAAWLPCSRNQGSPVSKAPLNLAQDQAAVPGPKKSSRIVRENLPMAQLLTSPAHVWKEESSVVSSCFIFLESIDSLKVSQRVSIRVYIYIYIYIYITVKTIAKTYDEHQIGDGLFHPVEGQSQFHTSWLTKRGLSWKRRFHLSKWSPTP